MQTLIGAQTTCHQCIKFKRVQTQSLEGFKKELNKPYILTSCLLVSHQEHTYVLVMQGGQPFYAFCLYISVALNEYLLEMHCSPLAEETNFELLADFILKDNNESQVSS